MKWIKPSSTSELSRCYYKHTVYQLLGSYHVHCTCTVYAKLRYMCLCSQLSRDLIWSLSTLWRIITRCVCWVLVHAQFLLCYRDYWNGNIVILMKFSSLAVVMLTTFGAGNDENSVKNQHFRFSDDVMKCERFRITGPLWWESTGHR